MACPQFISIHAPARGATGCVRFSTLYPSDFNPRSRKGSDQIERMEPTDLMISIHAPARGATATPHESKVYPTISIHAPARGATYRRMSCALLNQFQSTLPQGERRSGQVKSKVGSIISIHAPARGATAIITNFHTQLLFKITIFSYIASPLSFPSSLFPDI